jgi:hypothetical protein
MYQVELWFRRDECSAEAAVINARQYRMSLLVFSRIAAFCKIDLVHGSNTYGVLLFSPVNNILDEYSTIEVQYC